MHFLTSKNIERKKELILSRCANGILTEFDSRFYACHRRRCDLYYFSHFFAKVGKKVLFCEKENFIFSNIFLTMEKMSSFCCEPIELLIDPNSFDSKTFFKKYKN